MFNLATIIAMTPPAGGNQGGLSGMMPTLIMFGMIILIMYFLMIRPQQKRQKEHRNMLESIKKGDNVITTAGLHGSVTDIDGNTLTIEIAPNVKVKFEKQSIASVNK